MQQGATPRLHIRPTFRLVWQSNSVHVTRRESDALPVEVDEQAIHHPPQIAPLTLFSLPHLPTPRLVITPTRLLWPIRCRDVSTTTNHNVE